MSATVPLRYHLRIYRREHLGLPAGLWALFAIMVAFLRDDPARAAEAAGAFLGMVLPLLAGILAASAVVDDPALELQFATPREPWRILLERLGLILGIVAASALAFQVYLLAIQVDVSHLGNPAVRQLVWLVPSLALMGLSSAAALGSAQGMGGALAVGVVWLGELLPRGWFMASRWARYIFLFLGVCDPASPCLAANQLCLAALAVALTWAASSMLKKTERYL